MKHAKLLDCTLRDGAYVIDKKFGDNTIKGIISGLIDARIDLVEIGFCRTKDLEREKQYLKILLMQLNLSRKIKKVYYLQFWLM